MAREKREEKMERDLKEWADACKNKAEAAALDAAQSSAENIAARLTGIATSGLKIGEKKDSSKTSFAAFGNWPTAKESDCPHCGKCKECGRGGSWARHSRYEYRPYWHAHPTYRQWGPYVYTSTADGNSF